MGSEVKGQDYIPRQTTPSPVYPSLQVQVLIPAETFVQMANSEHPPLDQLHISSSEKKKKIIKPDLIFNICIGCVCVCRCVCVVVCVCINIFTFAVSSIAYISSHTHTGSSCTLWTCYTAAAEDKLFNNYVTNHDESEGSDQLPPFCHI